jgi:hypothetical protein
LISSRSSWASTALPHNCKICFVLFFSLFSFELSFYNIKENIKYKLYIEDNILHEIGEIGHRQRPFTTIKKIELAGKYKGRRVGMVWYPKITGLDNNGLSFEFRLTIPYPATNFVKEIANIQRMQNNCKNLNYIKIVSRCGQTVQVK